MKFEVVRDKAIPVEEESHYPEDEEEDTEEFPSLIDSRHRTEAPLEAMETEKTSQREPQEKTPELNQQVEQNLDITTPAEQPKVSSSVGQNGEQLEDEMDHSKEQNTLDSKTQQPGPENLDLQPVL